MARRRIFTVQTPLGHRVFLPRDRWRQIISRKHPALAGGEKGVRACLESPSLVRESTKDPDVHLHYLAVERGYLCVVTAPADQNECFVVTAYFTRSFKRGKELWKS